MCLVSSKRALKAIDFEIGPGSATSLAEKRKIVLIPEQLDSI
jgi:hypothetical protein